MLPARRIRFPPVQYLCVYISVRVYRTYVFTVQNVLRRVHRAIDINLRAISELPPQTSCAGVVCRVSNTSERRRLENPTGKSRRVRGSQNERPFPSARILLRSHCTQTSDVTLRRMVNDTAPATQWYTRAAESYLFAAAAAAAAIGSVFKRPDGRPRFAIRYVRTAVVGCSPCVGAIDRRRRRTRTIRATKINRNVT